MRLGLFAESLQSAGYSIEIIQCDPDDSPQALSRNLSQRMLDGLVFLNWPCELLEKPFFSLRERGIPTVASGTTFRDKSFTWTNVDEAAIVKAAVHRFVDEGQTHIALIDIAIAPTFPNVIRSFRAAMKRYVGCPGRDVLVLRATPANYETVRQATCDILDRQPGVQALLLTDNFLAQSVLNALQLKGREPGKDIRVISYGDTVLADQCRPRLSHYGLLIEEQVRLGTEALLDQIHNGEDYQPLHLMLPPEYIARET